MTPDWDTLAKDHAEPLVTALRSAYDSGSISFTAKELAAKAATEDETFEEVRALELMQAAGPWLEEDRRELQADPEFPDAPPESIPVFSWTGPQRRSLGWLLLIHGMNTKGAWQQLLAFDVGRWRGTSVPTFIHKYGHIVLGVVLPWRRRKFTRELRERILVLRIQAEEQRLRAAPDVVAHSFGTWMLGKILVDELKGGRGEVKLGRVILTGSILRPDFPWSELQRAGLVQDVLNHYATNDPIVPLAHWTIPDSGPSGRRGFDAATNPHDGFSVTNVEASPEGHSGALSDGERYSNYAETWKPFLTNPDGEAAASLDQKDPDRKWRQAWWPLRGTLFPIVAVPLLLVLMVWGLLALGPYLNSAWDDWADVPGALARYLGFATAGLFGLYVLQKTWCRLTKG